MRSSRVKSAERREHLPHPTSWSEIDRKWYTLTLINARTTSSTSRISAPCNRALGLLRIRMEVTHIPPHKHEGFARTKVLHHFLRTWDTACTDYVDRTNSRRGKHFSGELHALVARRLPTEETIIRDAQSLIPPIDNEIECCKLWQI